MTGLLVRFHVGEGVGNSVGNASEGEFVVSALRCSSLNSPNTAQIEFISYFEREYSSIDVDNLT